MSYSVMPLAICEPQCVELDTNYSLWLTTCSFAGSDTTAASLRAIFYYLCRNKEAQKKLLAEIDEADRKGELSDPVTFAESQNLRYFQAVIKEALSILITNKAVLRVLQY